MCLTNGYALRTQEKTIAQALKKVGYSTGHFGKWHLTNITENQVNAILDMKLIVQENLDLIIGCLQQIFLI